MDKTGTLTAGAMTVTSVITAADADVDEKEALLLAGAVEDASEHPIGLAIAREAAARFGGLPPVTEFAAQPGAGGRGRTAVPAGWDGQARAAFVIADRLKPSAVTAIARLRGLGLRPVLLTGDNERTALAVAGQLGIPADSVFAGVGPAGKAEVIRQLQAGGIRAAFVGDGVNGGRGRGDPGRRGTDGVRLR